MTYPCAHCNAPTRVINTELHPDGQHRWRRCTSCNELTRTIETCLNGRRRPGPLPNAKRKRSPRASGSRNGASVLTEADVLRLRAQAAAGIPRAALASEYGIALSSIARIVNRQGWTHIP